jgi:hypothetical protein
MSLCEGLTPAIMSKTLAVLDFLIAGGACMGSRMIDCSSYEILLASNRPGTHVPNRNWNHLADIDRESVDFSRTAAIL